MTSILSLMMPFSISLVVCSLMFPAKTSHRLVLLAKAGVISMVTRQRPVSVPSSNRLRILSSRKRLKRLGFIDSLSQRHSEPLPMNKPVSFLVKFSPHKVPRFKKGGALPPFPMSSCLAQRRLFLHLFPYRVKNCKINVD